jgi:quinol monooxygenase YgiN
LLSSCAHCTVSITSCVLTFGQVYCKPQFADDLAALYSKMTKIAKTEPGVIYYSLARNTTDPTIFHFFEHYANKAAFEAHTSREETQTILKGEWFKDCVARFEKPIV